MKYLLIVFLSISLAWAHEIRLRNGITPQKFSTVTMNQDIASKIDWEMLRSVVVNGNHHNLRAGSIEADVTNYTLAILANVANLIVHDGLDPLGLADTRLNIFPGYVDLTHGWLQDLSSITVSGPVIAKYSHSTSILELTLPLAFDDLLFDYSYHVQYILLSLTGSIDAELSDLKVDLHLGFNFSEYHAFVDKLDVKNSGNISIKFTGLGLLDWLIDLISDGLVNLFRTLIFSIVDAIIYNPVQNAVDAINGLIDSILNQNTTDLMTNTSF